MKKIVGILALLAAALVLGGCSNYTFMDATWQFDRAILSLPDGEVVSGNVDAWTDYSDGDQIQVTIDGMVYLVHSENIALISE